MTVTDSAPPTKPPRWTAQWKELYTEVITNSLCTGCAGCVVTCPHDVIGYEHEEGKYIPFHLEEELGLDNCIHGEKGCTTCTRACPRFRAWEPSADMHLFGRAREPDEMAGIWRQLYLTRASDDMVNKMGQDGGLVSAMLIPMRVVGAPGQATYFVHAFGGSIEGLGATELAGIFVDVPSAELSRADVVGAPVIDVATAAGLCQSKGAARRLVQSGGLYLNNNRVAGIESVVNADDLVEGQVAVLRSGKKNFLLVKVTD